MKQIKVFLSSRSTRTFAQLVPALSLAALRIFIRTSLEAALFLGEQMVEVLINENNFNSALDLNAFENCMRVMRSSNIIIILYNGEAGWAVGENPSANGICHEEFLVAVNEFSQMSFMLDLSPYFRLAGGGAEASRNLSFQSDVADIFPHRESVLAADSEILKSKILEQVKRYILEATARSFTTQKAIVSGASVFGDTLDWSKLTYAERREQLETGLAADFGGVAGFENIYKQFHGIPDSMAVAEARNLIGRPFLNEHTYIRGTDLKSGVIHFVAVYGNITETQAKNLVGYPDLTVIRAPFGLYLWEKNTHIQMFFLKACINPQTVKTRLSQVTLWLSGSRELARIVRRADARFSIISAINSAELLL